jgi:hypothetical protein
MKLEEQVTSLEISQKLKALGMKQDSLFYWKNYMLTAYDWQKQDHFWLDEETYEQDDESSNQYTRKRKPDMEIYSAFTVAELGAVLPNEVATQRKTMVLPDGTEVENQWCAIYAAGENTTFEYAPTEAEARGKLLFYLLENGYIKAEELATR